MKKEGRKGGRKRRKERGRELSLFRLEKRRFRGGGSA